MQTIGSSLGLGPSPKVGDGVLEQNDEWQLQDRYMQVEVMAELTAAAGAADPRQIPCAA
jgi:hypothetical protein